MEFQSYRSKGLNAYVAPVKTDGEGDLLKANYGKPLTEADQQKAYRSKKHTVVVDEATLPDGFSVWKEAGGADFNKAVYGWLEVRSGEVVREWDDRAKFRADFSAGAMQ